MRPDNSWPFCRDCQHNEPGRCDHVSPLTPKAFAGSGFTYSKRAGEYCLSYDRVDAIRRIALSVKRFFSTSLEVG